MLECSSFEVILEAPCSFNRDKAQGLDGFSMAFWNIVKGDC